MHWNIFAANPYGSREHLRRMTKAEAKRQFEAYVLPRVEEQYSPTDKPAIRQAWNEWVDSLARDGRITEKQAFSWTSPY
jgi:hypothetical protein